MYRDVQVTTSTFVLNKILQPCILGIYIVFVIIKVKIKLFIQIFIQFNRLWQY